jgi:DNA polymerase-3 subunit alpha
MYSMEGIELSYSKYSNLTKLPMAFRVLVIDTETSGLPKDRKAGPEDYDKWPRIVQVGAILYKCPYENRPGRVLKRYTSLVRCDGWSIDPGASKVHGITEKVANTKGKHIGDVLDELTELSRKAHAICCHNVAFDVPVILAEYHKNRKVSRSIECPIGYLPTICTMEIGKKLCRILTEGTRRNGDKYLYYKSPKLSEMYKHLTNEEFKGRLHDALEDCEATVTILDIIAKDHVPFLRTMTPGLFHFNSRKQV